MSVSVPSNALDDGSHHDSQPTPQQIAGSIESDFRLLIDNLDRHIELLSGSNSEVLSHLARAKAIAERGLRLGQRLSESAKQVDPPSRD